MRPPTPLITREQIARVLGDPAAALIDQIADAARAQNVSAYVVGGVVRDLLLERPNFDIDFVIEGDARDAGSAIAFAEKLSARFGGDVHSYRPFGTAKWLLAEARIDGIDGAALPDHIDFATARSEFYEQPTALPTVYDASIKRDLARRDFTINTLAIQLYPVFGRVLDAFNGLPDLRAGIIRVLHSLSFVDDPTRILRAVRFARRLNFTIEPRTNELIATALPMLRRITGERVRNELTLLLDEPDPAGAFLELERRGILRAIHPAFVIDDDITRRVSTPAPDWAADVDATALTWLLLLIRVPLADLPALSERLLLPKSHADSLLAAAELLDHAAVLRDPEAKPSAISARLDPLDDLARAALWITLNDDMPRTSLTLYAQRWRSIRPITDGAALKARRLKPGPCYGRLITRLRAARVDGDVTTDADEIALLDRLLHEGFCDDGRA